MEKEPTNSKHDNLNLAKYFTMLTPAYTTRKNSYNLQFHIHGYTDLFYLIIDLLKTAMLAIDGLEANNVKDVGREQYIGSLLKVIEKLIPIDEAALLDELHEQFWDERRESDKDDVEAKT
ncbi:hypothetical protein [Flavobacterium sp. SM2513]|uniref:hypothetical protein n=1 Tax=Flavobacterium sp. SM2513 TaxID=3424766 RepID=UPI003D7F27B4